MTFGVFSGDSVAIGNFAGWALAFHREPGSDTPDPVVSSSGCDASLKATLRGGLGGGEYSFEVEGLTDEDHRAVAQCDGEIVRLYLFWRDTNATLAGYLSSAFVVGDVLSALAPPPEEALVAELTVTAVSRRRGRTRYVTVVQARERAWRRLMRTPFDKRLEHDALLDAAEELGQRAGIAVRRYGEQELAQAQVAASERPVPPLGRSCGDAMRWIAARIEEITGKYGRGMLLIRDGTLHVGPRPVPLSGDAKELDYERGLIEVTRGAKLATGRRRYKLVLKGRPDLRPGDVVRFEAPAEDPPDAGPGPTLGLLDALRAEAVTIASTFLPAGAGAAGTPVELYVALVQHQLDREKGFSTVVAGVTVASGAWDGPGGTEPDVEPSADAAAAAADRIRAAAEDAQYAVVAPEIAEVRGVTVSGTSEPPSQTLTVWRGLEPADGRPHATRRLPVRSTDPDELAGVPYTTPFAWGHCGLILPRYPGTRVALLHRAGRAADPLDVGALWESGRGPQNGRPGDWWLILPVGVAEQDPPPAPERATNDLIDGDGNRVIEVGELTVRVGRGDKLKAPGERPERGEQDAVSIVHAVKGSKIVMSSDGSILIEAKAGLHLKAADDVVIDAANVTVNVTGSMEVK